MTPTSSQIKYTELYNKATNNGWDEDSVFQLAFNTIKQNYLKDGLSIFEVKRLKEYSKLAVETYKQCKGTSLVTDLPYIESITRFFFGYYGVNINPDNIIKFTTKELSRHLMKLQDKLHHGNFEPYNPR